MSTDKVTSIDNRRSDDRRHVGRRENNGESSGVPFNQVLLELRAILENATVGILFTRNRMLVRANPMCAQMFGYTENGFTGLPGRALYPSDAEYEAIGAEAGPILGAGLPFRTETQMRRQNGSLFWCRMSAKAVDPRRPQDGTIWIMEDISQEVAQREALARAHEELEQRVIERTGELSAANAKLQEEVTERQQAEQRIWHLAHHDALTGLPNRALLQDRLQQTLTHCARHGGRVAVLFLDLDRFKLINDTLGHEVGDELLKEVARRLRGVVRAADTVARLGGDEFVVVLHDLAELDDAVRVAEKILASFVPPVHIGEHELHAATSIGISISPDDGTELHVLMKCADAAMYQAKREGRNQFRFHSARLSSAIQRQSDLEHRLAAAIDRQQLAVAYQPVIDHERRELCGLEALLRWHDPETGSIAPSEFVPVAEDCGLIQPMGDWILREALLQNRRWQDAGQPVLPVAVNLTVRQFRHRHLVETLRTLLDESGQSARLLELEIPQAALGQEPQATQARLAELGELGVGLVLDDFGTGPANLILLKRFAFRRLKIDRNLIQAIGKNQESVALLAAVFGLARGLGIEVIAKGVETAAQRDALLAMGCRHFQGYLFARPTSAIDEQLFSPAGLA